MQIIELITVPESPYNTKILRIGIYLISVRYFNLQLVYDLIIINITNIDIPNGIQYFFLINNIFWSLISKDIKKEPNFNNEPIIKLKKIANFWCLYNLVPNIFLFIKAKIIISHDQ